MGKSLRVVFMGTSDFAVPSLKALFARHEVPLVVTQPDRRSGRGRKLQAPPVKQAAALYPCDILQPDVVKGKRFAAIVSSYEPDVLVTAAFGQLLGPSLLNVAPYGCLNVHASLLPRYRGAAPINHAIMNGDKQTGVTIMRTVLALDAGDILGVAKIDIGPTDTAGGLSDRLAELGAGKLIDVLGRLDTIRPVAQDESLVTYARPLSKTDGYIDWTRAAVEIDCQVRGLSPWPGTSCSLGGERLKVHRAVVLPSSPNQVAPGTVCAHDEEGLDVACGQGMLRITTMQLPGKRALDAAAFFRGHPISPGTVLG